MGRIDADGHASRRRRAGTNEFVGVVNVARYVWRLLRVSAESPSCCVAICGPPAVTLNKACWFSEPARFFFFWRIGIRVHSRQISGRISLPAPPLGVSSRNLCADLLLEPQLFPT